MLGLAQHHRLDVGRSVLTIGLLAIALAATTIVFSAADSLVFRRVAFPAADRLITFDTRDARTGRPGGGFASAAVLDEWRKQTDLFSGVHGHLYKTIFLAGSGEPELVPAADVTVGLIDMLGVRPRWGRTFSADDARQTDVHVAVIAEEIARRRFGDASRAVGQRIETTAEPLQVVGVMPASFRLRSGLAAPSFASRWAQSQLFGVKATDPITIVLATVAVAATALLATWHPARQATRVDPKVLLRN